MSETNKKLKKLAEAYTKLKKNNPCLCIPNCYDTDTSEQAIMFAKNSDDFYRMKQDPRLEKK